MKVDTNTNGHRQWFYFSVRNNNIGNIKFNIFRFRKKFSLFQRGLKPYIYSLKSGKGWTPGGTKVKYRMESKNNLDIGADHKNYYLSFQFKFQHSEDQVFFCCGIPYTYTYLQRRLEQFQLEAYQLKNKGIIFRIQQIGKSLCGLEMHSITIQPENYNSKRYLVISARTHAGEFSSSWVMDGLIKKIIGSQEIHEWMLQNQISFKIIPMLNPDGVFVGNYRTGIVGDDFNRKFATGKKQIFPEIYCLKKMIHDCKRNGKLYMFLDLHGHSILKNSFIYGPVEGLFSQNPLRSLSFNLWHSSRYFQFSSCKFRFQKDLSETARVYFQLRQNILAYTSETSLGLYYKAGKTIQMCEEDFRSFGGSIINAISQLMIKTKLDKEKQFIMPSIAPQIIKQKISKNKQFQQSRDISKRKKNHQQKQLLHPFNRTIIQRKKPSHQSSSSKKNICLEKLKNNTHTNSSKVSENIVSKKQQSIFKTEAQINLRKNQQNEIINKSRKGISVRSRKDNSNPKIEATGYQFYQSKNKFNKNQSQSSSIKKQGSETKQLSPKKCESSKFKIRKRTDIVRAALPQNFKKKIGIRVYLNIQKKFQKPFLESQQTDFKYERSITYDSSYMSSHLPKNQQSDLKDDDLIGRKDSQIDLDTINQKFSEEYQSINDSDSSSEDLQPKKKQYLLECIRNNRRVNTNANNDISEQSDNGQQQLTDKDLSIKINRFKEIQFKSLEPKNKNFSILRPTIRDHHKFREMTHKSLNRGNIQKDDQMVVNLVQKKQLNTRNNKKNQRQPYFLVQIKNKQK